MTLRSSILFPLAVGCAVFALVAIVTAPALQRVLSLDDPIHLRDYPLENRDRSLAEVLLLRHWQGHPSDGLWRPVPKVLWWRIGPLPDGRTAKAWSVTALLAGLCAGVYTWMLAGLRLAGEPRKRGILLAPMACLPLLHPLAADVLLPFVGQADLVAALGTVGACACWLHRGRMAAVAGVVFFLVALLSKESAMPGVVAIPLLVWLTVRPARLRRQLALRALVLAALCVIVRLGMQAIVTGVFFTRAEGGAGTVYTEGERVVPVLEVLDRYMLWMVFPPGVPQTDYSFLKQPRYESIFRGFLFIAVCVVVLGWLATWTRSAASRGGMVVALRSRRVFIAGAAWALLFLLPYLHLVPLGALWAGRFAFLPVFGLGCCIAALAMRERGVAPVVYTLALLGWGCVQIYTAADSWKDPERLWAAEIDRVPEHAFAWKNLGAVLDQRGDTEGAAHHFAVAVNLWPQYSEAWLALGQAASRLDALEESEAALRRAHDAMFSEQSAVELARVLARQRRFAEAEAVLVEYLESRPSTPVIDDLLARIRTDRAAAEQP